jgi:hypothetical protein
MFEHRSKPLLPRKQFLNRIFNYFSVAALIIGFSLLMGMIGYRTLAGIHWLDAFYNASMILTGMGPALDIGALPIERQDGIKLFAGLYALYSGVVFLAASSLALSPLLHRFFHIIHLDIKD